MACIFCKIASGEIPSRMVHQDEYMVAVEDLNPAAPLHLLLIPRTHIVNTLGLLPEDDAHRAGRIIAEADALIIGTPTHWGNMSSQLKLLLDRNVPVFMGKKSNGMPSPRQKGKPAIIVSACSTPYPFNFILKESRGAVNAVKQVLHYGGYRVLGQIVQPGTTKETRLSKKCLRQAYRLGQRVVR